jgi:hypothetical protein
VFDDVDIERLSPLGGDHITLPGRYRITLQSPCATAAAHRYLNTILGTIAA